MREVRVQGSDAFVIRSVSVLPESIPAGFSVLAGLEDDESLLIVDPVVQLLMCRMFVAK